MSKKKKETVNPYMIDLTEDEFIARCRTAYRMGFAKRSLLVLLNEWADFVMRFEHTWLSHGQAQGSYCRDFLEREYARTNDGSRTLAGDEEGYKLVNLASLLAHPCQKCATDKNAWHTRWGFCSHEKAENDAF